MDYVAKPFSPTELAARIRAALRKRPAPWPGRALVEPYVGRRPDASTMPERRVTLAGKPVQLTATEYAAARRAVGQRRPGAHPRAPAGAGLGREERRRRALVRNVVKLLRRKLGDDADNPRHIITEPRVGYWMARVTD